MSQPDDDRERPPTERSLPPLSDRDPTVSGAVTAAGRVVRDLPTAVLPAYLVALGAAGVARAPLLLALGVAVAFLAATGRIEPVLRAAEPLVGRDGADGVVDPADPSTPPGAPDLSIPPELSAAVADLASPTVVGLVVAGVLLSVLAFALVRGVSVAVTQSTVWAALAVEDDPEPARTALTAGVRGAGRWRTFLGLFLLRLVVGLLFVGAPLAATGVFVAAGSVAAAVTVLLGLGGVLVTLVVVILLSFAGPAAVVDDRGVVGAVRGSLGFFRHHPAVAVAFVVAAGGLYVASGVVAGVLGTVSAARVGALLTPLVVSPVVDLLATAVYAGVRTGPASPDTRSAAVAPDGDDATSGRDGHDRSAPGGDTSDHATLDRDTDDREPGATARSTQTHTTAARDDPAATATSVEPAAPAGPPTVPTRSRQSVVDRLRTAFGGGLRAFTGFAAESPLAVVGALAAFAVGLLGGWGLTAPAGLAVPPPENVGNVFGAFPVNDFLNIAANNWLVAATGVYSGLAFGVPAAVAAAFNGALVGALAGAFDLQGFVALVAPHGILEIPVLLVAWGLGLHLAGVGWRGVRGRTDAATVADELRHGAHVLGGVAVLLVVAALIEAFLTPAIAEFVL